LAARGHTLTTGVIQTGQVIKIKPIFILPLYLTFIGEVVDFGLWSTAGHESQDQPEQEHAVFQWASS